MSGAAGIATVQLGTHTKRIIRCPTADMKSDDRSRHLASLTITQCEGGMMRFQQVDRFTPIVGFFVAFVISR